MSLIYSSLSNPSGDLKQLRHEFADLFNFFNSSPIKKKADFQFGLNASIEELTTYLTEHQNKIRLFHFSGHSGAQHLDFGEKDFASDHVARFFNAISEGDVLQCVFLNGCENEAIVDKLQKVPVVIGTKSNVQDAIAHKVTMDFFRALIGGEKTYEQAFMDAVHASNIPTNQLSVTRAEGGRSKPKHEALNEYFIRINQPDIADNKFPFKPKKINWTKYLVLFLILAAGVIAWLKKSDIKKAVFGYDCSCISPIADKCNIVIADFTAGEDIPEPNQWLFDNVSSASLLRGYLNPINLVTFKQAIGGSRITREELPGLCRYQFNLTGSINREANGIRAEFNIYPYGKGEPEYHSVPYTVASLGLLDSLITYLSEDRSNVFVLHEMCLTCAQKMNIPNLPEVLLALADDYDPSHSSETYQRIVNDQAEFFLERGDTVAAVNALDQVITARPNDFALAALEKKVAIREAQKNLTENLEAQTLLISQLQSRVANPAAFEMKKAVPEYARAEDQLRFHRAAIITQHRDSVAVKYRDTAIEDYEHLDRKQYQQRRYRDEIARLKVHQPSLHTNIQRHHIVQ